MQQSNVRSHFLVSIIAAIYTCAFSSHPNISSSLIPLLYYLLLNLVLRLSKNANLVLIVPGSGTGLPGLLDSFVTSPSGISFEPPGTLIGVDMDSLSPSLNSLVILLAVRLCMYTCLFACLSALRSFRMFSLLLRRFE